MAVADHDVAEEPQAYFAHRPVAFYREAVGAAEADTLIRTHTPGFRFEVVGVDVHAEGVVAAASVDVKIGNVSVLEAPVVPVAGDEVKGVIKSDSSEFGNAGDAINVHVTTDGGGSITAADIRVWYRRRHADVSG